MPSAPNLRIILAAARTKVVGRLPAGRVTGLVRQEKERSPTGGKEILVLGDSRMGIGFSEEDIKNLMPTRSAFYKPINSSTYFTGGLP